MAVNPYHRAKRHRQSAFRIYGIELKIVEDEGVDELWSRFSTDPTLTAWGPWTNTSAIGWLTIDFDASGHREDIWYWD